jgi:hypothetical protein
MDTHNASALNNSTEQHVTHPRSKDMNISLHDGTYEIYSWPDGKPFYYIINEPSEGAIRLLPPYFPTKEKAQAWADSLNCIGLRVTMGQCLL